MKDKTQMIESGGLHEWVTISDHTMEIMVCKKTGWAPSKKIFLPIALVKSYIKTAEVGAAYEKHKSNELNRLAVHYHMHIEDLEKISDTLFTLKKDFYVKYAKDNIKEMKQGISSDKGKN
jgi:hypothetical protein